MFLVSTSDAYIDMNMGGRTCKLYLTVVFCHWIEDADHLHLVILALECRWFLSSYWVKDLVKGSAKREEKKLVLLWVSIFV